MLHDAVIPFVPHADRCIAGLSRVDNEQMLQADEVAPVFDHPNQFTPTRTMRFVHQVAGLQRDRFFE